MTFALPTWPGFTDFEPFEISKNVEPDVPLNGEQQRFLRPGSRLGARVTLPPMEIEDARLWVAALMRASREKALYEWDMPGLDPGEPGETTAGDASSANATVVGVAGLAGGYTVLAGQFFNHVKDGVRRLYGVVQTGTTPLSIAPPTRAPIAAGDELDFARPMIEGWIDGPFTWKVDAVAHYGVTFTIREAK